MTQEEKAKAYDEAIERARDYKNDIIHTELKVGENIMDYIFPELKESENERIRKALIHFFSNPENTLFEYWEGIPKKEVLAWLEKQSKPTNEIHYWTEEEIEPIISDYLRGAEHYGGMICRLRCLKPKALENRGQVKDSQIPQHEKKTSKGNDNSLTRTMVDKACEWLFERLPFYIAFNTGVNIADKDRDAIIREFRKVMEE